MKRIEISKIYKTTEIYLNEDIIVCGWIKTIRQSKNIGFIDINDGSCFKNLQVVFENNNISNFDDIASLNVGSSIIIYGKIILTPESKQPFEIHASKIDIEGKSDALYPLQKKKHSLEFLRTLPHLRARTNTFNAVFRVRSKAAFAVHQFFNERGFIYSHTPIITGSDCEGAGDMFRVTTLDLNNVQKTEDNNIDFKNDFFGKEASLTVSGQLEGEAMCLAFSNIYTFGPTFRAENSNTQRHAAEFWMIEPEIAFADLEDDMDLAEDMVKYVLKYILDNCEDEIDFFTKFYDSELKTRLNHVVNSNFVKVEYTEAIEILKKVENKFEFPVYWGCDLQTEHERYLTEEVYKSPTFIYNYPIEIKSFYMRLNDDKKTVSSMDLLVPGIGELIGGSQREERYDVLLERMKQLNINEEDYSWYLDLRKYGGVKHSGFGLGFERLIMYVTGMSNIRDVTLFPRTVGNIR